MPDRSEYCIADWRESTLSETGGELVGGMLNAADFDRYSDKIGSEMVARYKLGDTALASEITGQPVVTVGDLRRRRPHTTSPPSIEEMFRSSGLGRGFNLGGWRAITLTPDLKRKQERGDGDGVYFHEVAFLAVADLMTRRQKEFVSVAVVRADHKLKAKENLLRVQRKLSRGVMIAPSVADLYPKSFPPYLE